MKETEMQKKNSEKQAQKSKQPRKEKRMYYIQKEGEYTLSFYLDKMLYSSTSTGKSEEIPYEKVKEIGIKKGFSLQTLIKYLGIFIVGISLGAIGGAGITGSYSNYYMVPCLSSSILLLVLGIFMTFIPKERLVLEIKGDWDFLIGFPEKDLPTIEDIVYLVRNRTLKGTLKAQESKGIVIKNRKRSTKRREKTTDISSLLGSNEKIKFDIEGMKGSRIVLTDKRIIHKKLEKVYTTPYDSILDIKKEEFTGDMLIVGGLLIISFGSFIMSQWVSDSPGIFEVCVSTFIILLVISIYYLYWIFTTTVFYVIDMKKTKVKFSSKKRNDAEIEKAIKYAKLVIDKRFMEKTNEKIA